jgi:flagellar motor component MotA
MKIRFLAVLIIVLGLIGGNIFASGGIFFNYLNIPTIVFIVFGSLTLMVTSFSPGEIVTQFQMVFGKGSSESELKIAEVFFQMLRKFVFMISLIGFSIGLIAILNFSSDPSTLGTGFSLSFLSLFLGMIFDTLIVLPCQASIRKQIAALS